MPPSHDLGMPVEQCPSALRIFADLDTHHRSPTSSRNYYGLQSVRDIIDALVSCSFHFCFGNDMGLDLLCRLSIPASTMMKNTFPTHHSIISQC
ncbi:hypothetical protein CEP53_004045 [Fusarium sp. AF-6]|nr:hypothetical protein CEP53_004045 [Fusarium sp. AF-6]